jgi:hypothetical protein
MIGAHAKAQIEDLFQLLHITMMILDSSAQRRGQRSSLLPHLVLQVGHSLQPNRTCYVEVAVLASLCKTADMGSGKWYLINF